MRNAGDPRGTTTLLREPPRSAQRGARARQRASEHGRTSRQTIGETRVAQEHPTAREGKPTELPTPGGSSRSGPQRPTRAPRTAARRKLAPSWYSPRWSSSEPSCRTARRATSESSTDPVQIPAGEGPDKDEEASAPPERHSESPRCTVNRAA